MAISRSLPVPPETITRCTAALPPLPAIVQAADKLRLEIRQRAEAMPDHRGHIESYCPMAQAA